MTKPCQHETNVTLQPTPLGDILTYQCRKCHQTAHWTPGSWSHDIYTFNQ